MNLFRISAILLLTSIPLHADVVVEQKAEGLRSGTSSMKIKGDRARIDMDSVMGKATVFLDREGKMVTYVHQSKLALVGTMSDSQKAAKALLKKAGSEIVKPDPMTNTGQTEKVGEWKCEIWIRHTPSVTVKEWRSKDIPNLERVREQMAVIASAPGMGIETPIRGDFLVVKAERSETKGTQSQSITRISEDVIPDSDFTPPEGYREMTIPAP